MKKAVKYLLCSLLLLVFFVACGEKKEEKIATEDKPIVIGQTFVVGAIEPTVGGTPWSLTTHGLSETVFSVEKNGTGSGSFYKVYIGPLQKDERGAALETFQRLGFKDAFLKKAP